MFFNTEERQGHLIPKDISDSLRNNFFYFEAEALLKVWVLLYTIPPAAPPYSDSNAADGDSDRNDSGAEDGNDFV